MYILSIQDFEKTLISVFFHYKFGTDIVLYISVLTNQINIKQNIGGF